MTAARRGESDAPRAMDVHIHVQPVDQMKPEAAALFRRSDPEAFDYYEGIVADPAFLLAEMDRQGIARVGLVNVVSPEVTGCTEELNDFSLRYAEGNRDRLLPIAGVHARRVKEGAEMVDRLAGAGFVALKIHPPHQGYPANAHTEGLEALGAIYRRAEERGLPVMIHTGTSIFPGARCKYGRPMELDDVAVDFPRLRIIMAHAGRPLWYDEAFFLLRRHANLWVDLSGIPPGKIARSLPRLPEIGPRVLWGSDWPGPGVRDLKINLDAFLSLPFPGEWKRDVVEKNGEALFPSRLARGD